ncbi:MAG: hypothetical protein HYY28_17135 [Betaproteobacteria bacterium]|nr:hypothetical protein [Betaproteobacteria bacterium]
MGELPLTHALQGDEALEQVSRLHRKRIPSRDGFVAHYEQNASAAMLYVSRAYLSPVAMWQFSRMIDGIESGASNAEGKFTHLRVREQDGFTVYSALGLGQVHYFYRSGATMVWLAADADVARRALGDTLRLIR